MDRMSAIIFGLLIFAWLIPLVWSGFVIALVLGFRFFWVDRGLEDEVIYCARCRFDQRGAMEAQCSECGAELDISGLRMRGVHKPIGKLSYCIYFIVIGTVPATIVLLLIGSALPFNYFSTRSWELDVRYPQSDGSVGAVWVGADDRDGFGRFGEAGEVQVTLDDPLLDQVHQHDPNFGAKVVLFDWRDEQAVGEVFDRFYAFLADDGNEEETLAVRSDFILVCQAVGRGERPDSYAEFTASSLRLGVWSEGRYLVPHPAFVAFFVLADLAAIFMLIWLAMRHADRAADTYAGSRVRCFEQFEATLAKNQAM